MSMRLYISADIEGVGGLAHFDSGSPSVFDYPEARQWMTDEVIASCEGARAAGCDEVVISDSHLNGRNILVDQLPHYARLIRSWPRPLGQMEGVQYDGIAGAVLLGYHVGASAEKGLCPHTINGILFNDIRIEGKSVSETDISARIAAQFNVPIILVTGDSDCTAYAKSLLREVETVSTKIALSHTAADTLVPKMCCEAIRDTTEKAIRNLDHFECLQTTWPKQAEFVLKFNRLAELLAMLPQFERVNGYTVSMLAESAVALSEAITFIVQMRSLNA